MVEIGATVLTIAMSLFNGMAAGTTLQVILDPEVEPGLRGECTTHAFGSTDCCMPLMHGALLILFMSVSSTLYEDSWCLYIQLIS